LAPLNGELAKNSARLPARLDLRSHSSAETITTVMCPFLVIVCGPLDRARSITSLNFALASATVHTCAAIDIILIKVTVVIIVIFGFQSNGGELKLFVKLIFQLFKGKRSLSKGFNPLAWILIKMSQRMSKSRLKLMYLRLLGCFLIETRAWGERTKIANNIASKNTPMRT
jgi:hypothetical protein